MKTCRSEEICYSMSLFYLIEQEVKSAIANHVPAYTRQMWF